VVRFLHGWLGPAAAWSASRSAPMSAAMRAEIIENALAAEK
jgi:hypothetical protein